jgi:hypothetical protein
MPPHEAMDDVKPTSYISLMPLRRGTHLTGEDDIGGEAEPADGEAGPELGVVLVVRVLDPHHRGARVQLLDPRLPKRARRLVS